MSSSDLAIAALGADLDDALNLLREYHSSDSAGLTLPEPLPSLLQQCESLCAEFAPAEPIRSIHHLACAGGSLISKCIAALPNVVLLSEIDPLSRMQVAAPGTKPPFAPTDIIRALYHATRTGTDDIVIKLFRAAVAILREELPLRGLRLVLRDHPHSRFCTDVLPESRPTVHELLVETFAVRSVITVRHPLDSFLSLDKNNWRHFNPFTLEEYASRYIAFIDRHQGLPIVSYETFVAAPNPTLEEICGHLALDFHPLAVDLIGVIRISGDSGRTSAAIGPRPRRQLPEVIEQQRRSDVYRDLCSRLGYEP